MVASMGNMLRMLDDQGRVSQAIRAELGPGCLTDDRLHDPA